ncbi:MAG: DMT family transporter [Gammaproteobacteria bacterium]|nr:DMT family transporter [Gammaproteobacteria bacterium]
MSIPAAYIGVILIWSTTPLAIKWSGDEVGFLFGAASRMAISAVVAMLFVHLLRVKMPWHKPALHTYVAAGFGIYTAMLCVYWGAQYIPSGWVSVIFGLAPITTGVLATIWLNEDAMTVNKIGGALLGVVGLMILFGGGDSLHNDMMAYGVVAVLLSTAFHSVSAVWVKRTNDGIHGLAVTAGGLLLSAPVFLLTWLMVDGVWPATIPTHVAWSIVYLSLCGSVLGFALYYYLLHHMEASRTALIALITPVTALLLGNQLNDEPMTMIIVIGTAFIALGLLCYEYGTKLFNRRHFKNEVEVEIKK